MAKKKKKNDAIIKVFIDTSEKAFVEKSRMFFKNKGIYTEEKSLEDGDLKVLLKTKEFFTIERKRYDDFVSSYIGKERHLQDQAVRMNQNCKNYCCIIHGSFDDVVRASNYNPSLKRVKESTVQKIYQKMELVYKMPCFFVDTDVQYFNKVIELSEMLVKAGGAQVLTKSTIGIEDRSDLSILMSGGGIGEGTARLLMNNFNSPHDALYASREELLDINGIGEGTVLKIKELKEVFENGSRKKE